MNDPLLRARLWRHAILFVAVIAIAAALLSGCSVSRTDEGWSFTVMQLSASDEIQTSSLTVVGLAIMPSTATAYLGYVRSASNRIPTFDAGTLVPDVNVKTSVSPSGPFVIEELSVGQLTD